jgi:hypothetical protein
MYDPHDYKQTNDFWIWEWRIAHYDICLEQRKLQGHLNIENVGQGAQELAKHYQEQTASPLGAIQD